MAYDEQLADRIRTVLADAPGITEKRMFGGLAFLVGGHMSVAVSGQGGLLARVDPGDEDALLEQPGVRPMEMRGRPMTGWLRVDDDVLAGDDALRAWVDRSRAFAAGLPPKD